MHIDRWLRALSAVAAAPTRLPTRLAHPELVSYALFASLSRLRRRGRIRGIGAIVDVGANIGQFAFMMSRIWPRLPMYSFEPDPVQFEQLERTFARFGIEGRCFRCAVAETAGNRELFRYRQHTANSLHFRADLPAANGSCIVPTVLLDAMLPELGAGAFYLKLDVQGGELAALRGATELLRATAYVQVEVSVHSPYQAAGSAGAVIQLLEHAGFQLQDVLDELRSPDDGALQEMDLLFSRRVPSRPIG